jgi:hypothetical protein
MPSTTFTNYYYESAWVNEGSTAEFTVNGLQLTDDTSAVLQTLVYSLFDAHEQIVNDIEEVAVTPAETMTVVLEGADLYVGTQGLDRWLVFEGTYDSDAGSDLPLTHVVKFRLRNVMGVG